MLSDILTSIRGKPLRVSTNKLVPHLGSFPSSQFSSASIQSVVECRQLRIVRNHLHSPHNRLCPIYRLHSLPVGSSIAAPRVFRMNSPEQLAMFSIERFEERLKEHLEQMYDVKAVFEYNPPQDRPPRTRSSVNIRLVGDSDRAEQAEKALSELFSYICNKRYDDTTGEPNPSKLH